jgi:hypothetical protein
MQRATSHIHAPRASQVAMVWAGLKFLATPSRSRRAGRRHLSIADLGGTEIDLRFASPAQGNLEVVVAPVLRFADVGYNADVRIDQLNKPENIIAGFAPELFGRPLDDEDVLRQEVLKKGDITYYEWELKPHNLVSATAVGNRVFILSVAAKNSRTWQKTKDTLRAIQESFFVPPVKSA